MFVAVSYGGQNQIMTSGTYTLPTTPTTTIAPTTTAGSGAVASTTTASQVQKADSLPETGSSNTLIMFAVIALTLGGAVTVMRKRLLS